MRANVIENLSITISNHPLLGDFPENAKFVNAVWDWGSGRACVNCQRERPDLAMRNKNAINKKIASVVGQA